jgi:3',5'-cyclic AMP phosphodiesterase CpdA
MLRIAHLSDIHFGLENVAAVEGARSWLSSNAPDLCVISGDLTSDGTPEEFAKASEWVASLAVPTLVIPGNHDTPYLDLWARLTAPFARFEAALGPAKDVVWTDGRHRVAGINTARGVQLRLNWSKGAISAGQVRRALDHLGSPDGRGLRILACHHPLLEVPDEPMTARVRGGAAAARHLCDHQIDLVLSGHIHFPSARALPFGDGFTWGVGASTLSTRERGAPAGFNAITVHEDSLEVIALAWQETEMRPWRSWTLPRRQAPRA